MGLGVGFQGISSLVEAVLGGSWVVINGVISRATIHVRGLVTPFITTNEPLSRSLGNEVGVEKMPLFVEIPTTPGTPF